MAQQLELKNASEMMDLNVPNISQIGSSIIIGAEESDISTDAQSERSEITGTIKHSISSLVKLQEEESESVFDDAGEYKAVPEYLGEGEEMGEYDAGGEVPSDEELEEEMEKKVEAREEEYTNIDAIEVNSMGEEIVVQKLVPKLKEETFIKKKLVPIVVKFNRIGDGDEVIEEEEVVEEEMTMKIVRTTVLIKEINDKGDEILVERIIEKEERFEEKPKKKKKIVVRRKLSADEWSDEEIEIDEEGGKHLKEQPTVIPEGEIEGFEEGIWEDEFVTEEMIDEHGEAFYTQTQKRIWKKTHSVGYSIDEEERNFKIQLLTELRSTREKLKVVKMKNKYLGKKMCEYYKLKGRDGLPKIPPEKQEILRKQYNRRLLEFNEIRKFVLDEKDKRYQILDEAKQDTDKLRKELNEKIEAFFDRQREVVKKLDPHVCKMVLPHVNFEKLINTQYKMDQLLSKVRLQYVKKMNQFTELKQKHALRKRFRPSDREDDMDIVTYEHMRVATRDLNDKLDIKETQILALKEKLAHAVQTLAHVRFKTEAIDNALLDINKDILEGKRELKEVKNECVAIREKRSKVMRDVQSKKDKVGLLKYPRLLKDFYTILDDKKFLAKQLLKAKMLSDRQKDVLNEIKKKSKKQMKEHQFKCKDCTCAKC